MLKTDLVLLCSLVDLCLCLRMFHWVFIGTWYLTHSIWIFDSPYDIKTDKNEMLPKENDKNGMLGSSL